MRALADHGPGDISVQQRPDAVRTDGEVLIEIVATGICGSDIRGHTGERHPDQVMGHETVGIVVDAAPSSDLAVGDSITVNPVIGCRECAECAPPTRSAARPAS